MSRPTPKTDTKRDAIIAEIARRHLGIGTLEEKRSGEDFHEVAVWAVEAALKAAFAAGAASAATATRGHP